MHCQTVGEDAIVDCIRAYINLQTLPAVQNEALDRLTDSIFRMEVRYISRLLSRRSEIEIDIHLLANDVAYDFLDRYLIGQYRNFVAAEHVIPLLKKMARSGVVNAIRDSHRLCRHPDRSQDYGGRIIQLKFADSITDPKPGGQPGDSLALEELVDEFESRLSDPILRAVYRLMILGFSAIEIAAKLNWEKRTTERLIVQVRKELQSWSESSFYCARGKRQEARKHYQTKGENCRGPWNAKGSFVTSIPIRGTRPQYSICSLLDPGISKESAARVRLDLSFKIPKRFDAFFV